MHDKQELEDLKKALEIATIVCTTNQKGDIIYVNDNFCKISKFKREELIGQNMRILSSDFHPKSFFKKLNKTLEKGEIWKGEIRNKAKDLSLFWIEATIIPFLDPEKKPYQYLCIQTNITERKVYEKKLADTNNFIESITRTLPDLVYILDIGRKKIIYLNKETHNMTGQTSSKIMNSDKDFIFSLINPKDVPNVIKYYNRMQTASDEVQHITYRINKDGSDIWFSSTDIPFLRNKDGSVKQVIGIVKDITQTKVAELKALENDRKLKEAQKIAQMGSWEIDFNRNEIFYSDEFFEVVKITDKEEIEKCRIETDYLYRYIHLEDIPKSKFVVHEAHKNFKDFNIEQRFITKNQEIIHISSKGSYIFDEGGRLLKLFGTIQNITEIKKKEFELIKAKQEAELAAQVKEQFISTMSHEIRTPLNAVIGMTHLLLQESPKASQVGILNTLKFSAENLLTIINDVLDFSKIEAGKIDIEKTDFSLKNLMSNIEQLFSYKAIEKDIDFEVLISAKVPEVVVGDPTRLNQILTNLISNAIKFTDVGSVTVYVTLIKNTVKTHEIQFCIEDTGIGIAKTKIKKIFDRFTQAENHITRKFGGTGLGLSITKRLIELQNSEIFVESKIKKGSKFYFTLSFDKSNISKDTAIMPDYILPSSENLINIKVLLVEDRDINRMIATKFLRLWGIKPDYAINGRAALEKVNKKQYDIILMDLMMPGVDGYEATIEIRKMENYKHTPIIALSASALAGEKEKAIKAGVNDYITKPFNPNELYNKIIKNLNNQNLEYPKTVQNLIDLDAIRNTFQNDEKQQKKLIKMLLDEMNTLKNEYSDVMSKKDFEEIRRIVHNQQGLAGLFGTSDLLTAVKEGKELLERNSSSEILNSSIIKVNNLCNEIIALL